MDWKAIDLSMMRQQNVGGWPQWPFLPVKKSNPKGGIPDVGVLIDSGPLGKEIKVEPIVYAHNIFAPTPFDPKKIIKKYDSLEALQADGWQVD